MSLIGSLEDLSLGDILQILSLSQKSGLLVLRTDEGEGRIALRGGLVSGAATKCGPNDLRDVLVAGGFVAETDFDAAEATADFGDQSLVELLVAAEVVTAEKLDALRRQAVENAVIAMFGWTAGDFSFDSRGVPTPEDPQLVLDVGINAQYLAMEAVRRDDESDRAGEAAESLETAESDDGEMSAHEMFGVTVDEASNAFTSDSESRHLAVAELARAALSGSASSELEPMPLEEPLVEWVDEPVGDLLEQAVLVEPLASELDSTCPVVVIDADLAALEWAKAALGGRFERVHIFQRSDLGLARIRQYLARAIAPIVLIAPDTPGDRLSGIRDAADFVRRIKQQAPRTHVVWLQEDGSRPLESVQPADALAIRPAGHHLRNASARERVQVHSDQLIGLLCESGRAGTMPVAVQPARAGGCDLDRLK